LAAYSGKLWGDTFFATCAMAAKAASSGSRMPRSARSVATAKASAMRGMPNGTGTRM
jgi:hypothetical protein